MSRLPRPVGERPSNTASGVTSAGPSPLIFFILVFVLSVPFWLLGAETSRQVLPGLPMSSFMWVCPAIAAAMLVYKREKHRGRDRVAQEIL